MADTDTMDSLFNDLGEALRRGQRQRLLRTTPMVHLAAKAHFDRETLGRVNSAFMVTMIGSGLVACAIGALFYDVGRLIAVW
jgi:hypothetical protein